jgi:hypothetical protein
LSRQHRDFKRLRRELGPEHPEVLTAQLEYALELFRKERFRRAESVLSELRPAQTATLSPDDPEVGRATRLLAMVEAELQSQHEQEKAFLRYLHQTRERVGDDHPEVADVLLDFARYLLLVHRRSEGVRRCREALAIRERALGLHAEPTLEALRRLIGATIVSSYPRRWVPLFQTLYLRSQQKWGEEHSNTRRVTDELANQLARYNLRRSSWQRSEGWV